MIKFGFHLLAFFTLLSSCKWKQSSIPMKAEEQKITVLDTLLPTPVSEIKQRYGVDIIAVIDSKGVFYADCIILEEANNFV